MNKTIGSILAVSALGLAVSAQAAPTNDELLVLIEQQQKEIERLKQEQDEADKKIEATADMLDSGSFGGSKSSEWAEKTKIGGYGEHHLNIVDGSDDKIDAHRFVLFVGHEFSNRIRFFSEFELEHGLAGEGKPGEVELEQAYIQWDFANKHRLTAGQFLIPVGILNETHEPETFYGTERNLVEKNIIPTTWWETGAMVSGELAPGLSYDIAVHSGLENDAANIRSGRQKSANAVANDYAYTGRIKYTAINGLELAATVQYQEDISQGNYAEASGTLLETHAIYTVENFSVRGLYASWNLDGQEAQALSRDSQSGYYIEPSYKFTPSFGVFARYSEWNNMEGDASAESDEVVDVGFNYWLHPQVVFKVDYSDYQDDDGKDALNMGIGWSF